MASSFQKSRCFILPHVSFCPGLPYLNGTHCGPECSFRPYGYDVMTFESTQPTPFCLEKSSVRKWTIYVLAAFSVRIELE